MAAYMGQFLLQRAGHFYFGVVPTYECKEGAHIYSSLGHFLGDSYVKMNIHIFVAAKQQKDLYGHPLLHSYVGIAQTA